MAAASQAFGLARAAPDIRFLSHSFSGLAKQRVSLGDFCFFALTVG